jgi:hypothetical protein
MKPEKVILLSCSICAFFFVSLGLSYWLGYANGSKSKSRVEGLAPLEALANNRGSQPAPAAQPARRGQPAQPAQRTDPLANIAKGPFTFPTRASAAGPELIDLTKWYNATLTGTWHGTDAGNDFKSLPSGLQTFDDTKFDVRGFIQVRGPFNGKELYPTQVKDIHIGLLCKQLHFLHNACGGGNHPAKGAKIGSYVIHYANGLNLPVPLLYGEALNDWWSTPTNKMSAAVVAWTGSNQVTAKNNAKIHIVKFTWENPQPDVEITTLDIVSDEKESAPFLIAITAEQ